MCDKYGNYIGEGFNEDDSDASMSYASTVITNTLAKARRKELNDAKRLDSGYNKFFRTQIKEVDGKTVKKRTAVELYTCSNTPGRMIRSAIGGAFHSDYRVGKTDEYIFFKIGMCTGECQGESNTMYFDTPEQYEKTFDIVLPQEMKDSWYARFNSERKYREELAAAETSKVAVSVK
jgi:hypothetical protein